MTSVYDEVAESLGGTIELIPYLPDLLSDVTELGGSAELTVNILMSINFPDTSKLSCLDLGCGKGLIALQIADELGCKVLGIDGMSAFIKDANQMAEKRSLQHLCTFENADIKERIYQLSNFDIVILSAVGHLWGTFTETLAELKKCVKPGGIIIIDDGYTENNSGNESLYITRNDALVQIAANELEILQEIVIADDEIQQLNRLNTSLITIRAEELKMKFPDKTKLFDNYVNRQKNETEIFGTKIKCVVWALRKK